MTHENCRDGRTAVRMFFIFKLCDAGARPGAPTTMAIFEAAGYKSSFYHAVPESGFPTKNGIDS
jgi:hypothetical protein